MMFFIIESLQPNELVATNFTVYVPALKNECEGLLIVENKTEFRNHLLLTDKGID